MIERPSVRVIITRKDKTKVLLLEKVVEIRSIFHKELRQDRGHTQWWSESYIEFPLQIQRVYEERTDVTYEVKVTKVNSIGKYGYFDKYTATFEIPSSHDWVNSIEITAVSDTSKLGEVQGEGEVSYIAMEVD